MRKNRTRGRIFLKWIQVEETLGDLTGSHPPHGQYGVTVGSLAGGNDLVALINMMEREVNKFLLPLKYSSPPIFLLCSWKETVLDLRF